MDGDFDEREAKTMGMEHPHGARIVKVEENSPAADAALQENDVIVAYDNVRVESDTHFIGLVKLTEIGDRVLLTVLRDGQPLQMFVQIGDAN